jgi:hypothetical protein
VNSVVFGQLAFTFVFVMMLVGLVSLLLESIRERIWIATFALTVASLIAGSILLITIVNLVSAWQLEGGLW